MHRPVLRIVAENGALVTEVVPAMSGTYIRSVKVPSFDPDALGCILCLPMSELHGNTFANTLGAIRPQAVVDLRPFPYFDLITVDRDRAFALFTACGASYIHDPLSLHLPADQVARSALRRSAIELLERVERATGDWKGPFVFLVNTKSDHEILRAVLCEGCTDQNKCWSVDSV
jgi:hypothetical protein